MEKVEHVLIVDDDREIRELIGTYLQKNGARVSKASGGREMWAVLANERPDIIVLDVTLPGENGLALCRDLRAGQWRTIPILMLTALGDETDRVVGLEVGADDYLVKPFAVRELLARIRAILRRSRMAPHGFERAESPQFLLFGEWKLDTIGRHLLDSEGTMVALSGAEYRLLRVFTDHPQRVLTRDQLLTLTQGRQTEPFDRSIDLLVSRLRQRLKDEAKDPRYIKTLRNEGYVFSAAVTPQEGNS
ncbi:response regulator [Paraburkholderia humisilvae]|uniref:Transcriptional regulatory protein OmpR n=1 Tax=Paraburkholderia humisilvae TaxID=627669 RepID=A0A6J5EA80_9BURK|nr:response regulator transcription factor [Paraburkholderia humisilvae]CAB3762221.1 Transcriptional regulatory protein OmpR [Paraburkholderia humisilvae]